MLWIKRIFWLTTVVLAIALAVMVSGLNSDPVTIDLYFQQFELTMGVALLLSLLAGLLLGLLFAAVAHVMPLKARLRRLQRQLKRLQKQINSPAPPAGTVSQAQTTDRNNPTVLDPPA